jgi:RNA polymerase sigma-70 factor (sigma-E family)
MPPKPWYRACLANVQREGAPTRSADRPYMCWLLLAPPTELLHGMLRNPVVMLSGWSPSACRSAGDHRSHHNPRATNRAGSTVSHDVTIDDSTLALRARGTGRPVTAAESFDAFVLARSRRLLRIAYLLTQDHALAEDLVQTALAKAWFAWSRIEGGDPEPYVRKVMVNTYSSWWRRRWNGEHPTDELPETAVPASAEERTDVWQALQRLPRRQRAVVVLRYYEDLSEAETARVLGCSTGTVKSQTSKAFAKLRLDPALLQADDSATAGTPADQETSR